MRVVTTIPSNVKVGMMATCTDCGQHEEICEVTDTQVWTYDEGDSYEFEGHATCFACTEFRKEELRILIADAIDESKLLLEIQLSK